MTNGGTTGGAVPTVPSREWRIGWLFALCLMVSSLGCPALPVVVREIRVVLAHRGGETAVVVLLAAVVGLVLGIGAGVVFVVSARRYGRTHSPDGIAATLARQRWADSATAAFGCLSGACALAWSVRQAVAVAPDPVNDRVSAALLGAVGVGLIAFSYRWLSRRLRANRAGVVALSRQHPTPRPLPAPVPAAAVEQDLDGAWGEAAWWVGVAAAIMGLLILVLAPGSGLVPAVAALTAGHPPRDPMWLFTLRCLVVVAWIAVAVAFLRSPRLELAETDPLIGLDLPTRRELLHALHDVRSVPEDLRPVARAHLQRAAHHGRRADLLLMLAALLLLLEGATTLVHPDEGPCPGWSALALGLLALVAVARTGRARRRAARDLALLGDSG